MSRRFFLLLISIFVPVVGLVVFGYTYLTIRTNSQVEQVLAEETAVAEWFLERRQASLEKSTSTDPFGDDKQVHILLLGLDNRAGQSSGHCDVIQFIEINTEQQLVDITAVPRGTYSPLPGGPHASSSYYVSNACGIGGLEYGIKQIERILGKQADYLVTVGFSETLGLLRNLDLPTTETLQWLRHRKSYAIGEPQRARNHSTFIKQMMIDRLPTEVSAFDVPLYYILYKMVHTDLTFSETQDIVAALIAMDVKNHPERIRLFMRPKYPVQDIPYDPEHAGAYVEKRLEPIKHWLSPEDYRDVTIDDVQQRLLDTIEQQRGSDEFMRWAYDNDLWLQIEDEQKRLMFQYDVLVYHLGTVTDTKEQHELIGDYVLEMKYLGYPEWSEKGKLLLEEVLGL